MKPYIIETDLGHDPDDLFCICHMAEMGLPIKAIGLVPGSPEQVALACGMRQFLGLDFEIGVAKVATKPERLGIHDTLCERHNWKKALPDGLNETVFLRALLEDPECDILVIGPAPGLNAIAHKARGKMTFQGGFLPYSLYRPNISVAKMEGHDAIPTFNFNGCREAVTAVLAAPLKLRRFCGKNVCHSIVLNKDYCNMMTEPRNQAGELYLEAVKLYFERHEEKKMHDPTALACHLHPEIATWFRGSPVRQGGNWSTKPDPNGDYVLADVDRDKLWEHILKRT